MAIPENIEQLANDVRTKVYGREVREALASGIEAAGETAEDARIKSEDTEIRQTVLEKQFDDEIANMTLADPSSAEIVAARTNANTGESYDTIGRRLDAEHANVTTQLADIMGLNNFNIIPTYTNDLLTKVEEKDGDTIKSMSTITYNSDGTVKSVTDTLNGKSVMYTFNYVNDQLQSISRQVGV